MKTKILLTTIGVFLIIIGLTRLEAVQAAPAAQLLPIEIRTAFDVNDWTTTADIRGQTDYLINRETTVGNDSFLAVTHYLPPVPAPDLDWIILTHLYPMETYDPATQGAIEFVNIDFTANILQENAEDVEIGIFLAMSQDGQMYRADQPTILNDVNHKNQWTSHTVSNIDASEFVRIGGDPAATPDFSANGAPITFGFYAGTARTTTVPVMDGSNMDTLVLKYGMTDWGVEIQPASTPTPPAWTVYLPLVVK